MSFGRYLGLAKETTYGTRVPPAQFFFARSVGLGDKKEGETLDAYNVFSELDYVVLREKSEFVAQLFANYNGLAQLWHHMMGSSSTTGAGPYTHVAPDAAAGIPAAGRIGKSFSVEDGLSASMAIAYPGCKIVTLRHALTIAESSKLDVGFKGKPGDNTVTPATVTLPTLEPIIPTHMALVVGGTTVSGRTTSAILEVSWPVDETYGFGSTGFQDEPDTDGPLAVALTVEGRWPNFTDYFNQFKNKTTAAVTFSATKSASRSVSYSLPKCYVETLEKSGGDGRTRLGQQVKFKSVFNTALTEALVATIVNSDASANP